MCYTFLLSFPLTQIHFSSVFFSTRDMSPSPMTLCPLWICGDFFFLSFLFFTTTLIDCFMKLQTGETLILLSGRYWANTDHKFYIYIDFSCSQREQHFSFFFFFFCCVRKSLHVIALSKKTTTTHLTDWQTSGSATPLFLSSVLYLLLVQLFFCVSYNNVCLCLFTQRLCHIVHQSLVLSDRWSAKEENIHLFLSCTFCNTSSVKCIVCDEVFVTWTLCVSFTVKVLRVMREMKVATQVCRQCCYCCCSVLYFYIQSPSLRCILYW